MKLILDTNIFVAAGFNKVSSSAKIVSDIRKGAHEMMWNKKTRSETKRILEKIPPLKWSDYADLFRPEWEFKGKILPNKFRAIKDREDRKFAALAETTDSTIITNDDHLLEVRSDLSIDIKTPSEFTKKE